MKKVKAKTYAFVGQYLQDFILNEKMADAFIYRFLRSLNGKEFIHDYEDRDYAIPMMDSGFTILYRNHFTPKSYDEKYKLVKKTLETHNHKIYETLNSKNFIENVNYPSCFELLDKVQVFRNLIAHQQVMQVHVGFMVVKLEELYKNKSATNAQLKPTMYLIEETQFDDIKNQSIVCFFILRWLNHNMYKICFEHEKTEMLITELKDLIKDNLHEFKTGLFLVKYDAEKFVKEMHKGDLMYKFIGKHRTLPAEED